MMNDEEFKNEVYERFEKYKAKKAKTRKNILKYGSMTLSALLVAVAVASPAFRSVFSKSRSAPTMNDKSSSLYDVDIDRKGNKSAESGGWENYNEVEANGETSNPTTDTPIEDATTYAATMAIQNATVLPTQAATAEGETLSTTACATECSTQAATTGAQVEWTTTPASTGETVPTEQNEKYDPSPDVSVVGAENIDGYLVGIKFFAETGEAVAAEDAELSAGSGVKRYKYQTDDYDESTPRVCFGVTVYGALIIEDIVDDGETLTYHFRLFEYAPDPLRYINIFTVAGDRRIVLDFSKLPTDKGGNE